MALGKYARVDNKRAPASFCSTVTIVVFVALCLLGVWMMTSSSTVVPVQNVDETSVDSKNEVKEEAAEISSRQFEGNSVELPEDVIKGDKNISFAQSESNALKQDQDEKTQKKDKEKSNEETKSDDGLNTETQDVGTKKDDSKTEDVGSNSEAGETKADSVPGGKEDSEQASNKSESDSNETGNNSDLDGSENNSDKDDSAKHSDENSSETKSDKNSSENSVDTKSDTNSDETENSIEPKSALNSTEAMSAENSSLTKPDENSSETKTGENTLDIKSDENSNKIDGEMVNGQIEDKVDQTENKELETTSGQKKDDVQAINPSLNGVFPSGAQSELRNENMAQNGSFSTQATMSKNEKESQLSSKKQTAHDWKVCNVTAGPDYIPCLDNWQAIKTLQSTKHYEHRERHCPEDPPTCLVSLPEGYKHSIGWPQSREKIWYYNVPHTKLAQVKGHQNWVKVSGEFLTFPGGGTQFKHGALHYIDFIQESVPEISWGNRSRVILDVGCGVASLGGFLFDRDVLTMSLAPKDEHEAQVQFALERGIPAISAVMGTKRLPFPARVFDIVHCARCRVPWHIEGGKLLLELNRVLRPGGFFVWSATPVYQKLAEDVQIWKAMTELTKKMCWEVVSIKKDKVNSVGVATYRKPISNDCYERRSEQEPPLCSETDNPNASWNVLMQACMHKVPVDPKERGSFWPEKWPARLGKAPYWLLSTQVGVYGKPAAEDFVADNEHWKRVVTTSYLNGMGINWSTVRNVMDMRAVYGGFAAALKDMQLWVMNVVPIDSADTLPIIYERGLFGIYHDWCESFNTYPRSYDLLHADHLFSKIKKRCNLVAVVAEVDRMLRPEGKFIVRDNADTITELESLVKSMQWDVRLTYSKDKEALLWAQKTAWRPTEVETISYAIA